MDLQAFKCLETKKISYMKEKEVTSCLYEGYTNWNKKDIFTAFLTHIVLLSLEQMCFLWYESIFESRHLKKKASLLITLILKQRIAGTCLTWMVNHKLLEMAGKSHTDITLM